jgi:hypothetical protein
VWRIAIAWNNRQAEVRFGQKRKEGASVSASGLISGLSRFMHRPRCAGGSGTLIGCRNADYANRVTGKTNVLDQKYRLLGASLIPEQPFMVQSGRSQRVLDYLRCKCPPQPACRVVANCALWFAIFTPMILACDAWCRAVPRGSFAISFANLFGQMSQRESAFTPEFRTVVISRKVALPVIAPISCAVHSASLRAAALRSPCALQWCKPAASHRSPPH